MSELVVSVEDYRYFVERAVRGMAGIVSDLGDELACARPASPDSNSAYGLLTHCLGVLEYWAGHLIAGRTISRDRSAEFEATGPVDDLLARTEAALAQFELDLAWLDSSAAPRNEPAEWALGPQRQLNQGGVLLHVYEEMSQHYGQLEGIRDAVRSERAGHGPDDSGFDDLPLPWLRGKRSVKWHRPGPELLPAWVADMDFPVAPAIRSAILATVDRGDLGYPDWPSHPLAELFSQRMSDRYGWQPAAEHVRGVSDLIQSLQIVLELATAPGDGVVAHLPNYPPFLATVQRMGRKLIPAPLIADGPSWTWDRDQLAAAVAGGRAEVLLLVNPQNPTGRVFDRAELEWLAELAQRHDLLVVSDEIHAELAHRPHQHLPFASLSAEVAARTVTVTSATKTFNIAGLRTAIAQVGPTELRQRWDAQPPDLFGAVGVIGVEATRAAWTDGAAWLEKLNAHLLSQRDHLIERIAQLPGVSMRTPQAGYLAWLDCSAAGLPTEPAEWFRQHGGVELSRGADFDLNSAQHARLNFATSRTVLDQLVDRLAQSLPAKG